jgi:hypothetical protein
MQRGNGDINLDAECGMDAEIWKNGEDLQQRLAETAAREALKCREISEEISRRRRE